MTTHTTGHPTPGAFRAHLDGLVRRIARVALEECEASARAVWGATLGVDRRRVDEWLIPDGQKRLSVADALAGPAPVRHALARALVGDGHVIAALPASEDGGADLRTVAASIASHAQAIRTTIDALADGTIDPAEGREIARHAELAIEDLVTLLHAGKRASVVPLVSRRPA